MRGEDAGARGGGDASGGTCGVDLVDGGAGRRNLPHKLSDLPPHRIIDAIAVADARHTDISSKRESSIASVDVLAKMRIGCEERSEAAR